MSIVYTADVFCDGKLENGEPCGQWTSGTTGSKPPEKWRARAVAKNERWKHVGTKDFCPMCILRQAEAFRKKP